MESPRGQFVTSSAVHQLHQPLTATDQLVITPLIKQYVSVVKRATSQKSENQPKVEVNESLGILEFAYEKIRNRVEYREDHVLLRSAIKRILKRRLNPLWQYESIASALLRELIWARYLKNDSIPESKIEEIEDMLRKYNVLRQAYLKVEDAEDWQDWIIGIAACDIEQVLVERQPSNALAEVMYQTFLSHVQITGLPAEDKEIQIYLAIHRTLLKSDSTLMTYHLFMLNAQGWKQASEVEAQEYVA